MSKSMRKMALAFVVVLVLSMASLAVGELMLNGTATFKLKYDGTTGTITGNQILNFNSSLKGTAVYIKFGDDTANGFYKSIDFWDNWPTKDGYKFSPYYITANIRGALYQNGPKVTTTLGDFLLPVPNYVAGQFHRTRVVGVMVADHPIVKGVTLTGFFGWPKYGAGFTLRGELPSLFYNQGFVLNAKNILPGLTEVKAYMLNHMHQDGSHLLYGDALDKKKTFTAINAGRGGDQLILYTPGFVKNTNEWGREALIGPDGTVLAMGARVLMDGANHLPVPANHYVLSGHGTEDAWINNNCQVGKKIKVNMFDKPKTTMAESTYGIEAIGAVAGVNMSGKFLLRDTFNGTGAQVKKEMQYAALANADYTLKTGPVSTKISAGFRKIDQKFAPFARETNTDYNAIEAKRGQLGGNVGLNFTLPVSTTLALSGDYYNKKITNGQYDNISGSASVTNSHFFGVTAKVAASGSRGVNTVNNVTAISDSLTTSGSLARDWALPNKDKVNTTYSLKTTNLLGKKLADIKFTNKLAASTTLTLPVVNKVGLEASAEFATLAGNTTPTYVGKLTHTLPNGLALEAKATKAGTAKLNWYTQVVWSASW